MPYSVKRYGTRVKFAKMKRCVTKISAQGGRYNPYAVCRSAIYGKDKNYQRGFADANKGIMPPPQYLFVSRTIPSGYIRGWMDAREKRRK